MADLKRIDRLGKLLGAFVIGGAAHAGACGQSPWEGLDIPGGPITPQQTVFADTVDGGLYFAGFNYLVAGGTQNGAIFSLENGAWDTLGTTNGGFVRSIVRWHDTLFIGGLFTSVDTVPMNGVAYWNGGDWMPYGDFNYGVRRLRIIEDTLYAVGAFDQLDGVPTWPAVKRVGGAWQQVATAPTTAMDLADITKYNGKLIAIGGAGAPLSGRVYAVVNGEWQSYGTGIAGSFSMAESMVVFQGDLYLGGQISVLEGNAGQGVMRWDGTQFHALGSGLQITPGDNSSYCGAWGLVVHDGLLYVVNTCQYAGGLYAPGLATWDGAQWCAMRGEFVNDIDSWLNDIAFLNDTLYAACGPMLDGVNVGYAARAAIADLLDTCAAPVGLAEQLGSIRVRLSPNPANAFVTYELPATSNADIIDLMEMTGRTVASRPCHDPFGQVDVSGLKEGTYLVVFRANGGIVHREPVLVLH